MTRTGLRHRYPQSDHGFRCTQLDQDPIRTSDSGVLDRPRSAQISDIGATGRTSDLTCHDRTTDSDVPTKPMTQTTPTGLDREVPPGLRVLVIPVRLSPCPDLGPRHCRTDHVPPKPLSQTSMTGPQTRVPPDWSRVKITHVRTTTPRLRFRPQVKGEEGGSRPIEKVTIRRIPTSSPYFDKKEGITSPSYTE